MPVFAYRARSPQGNILKATVEAADQRSAMDSLRAQRMIVLEIKIGRAHV